jgi:hypothetical protein
VSEVRAPIRSLGGPHVAEDWIGPISRSGDRASRLVRADRWVLAPIVLAYPGPALSICYDASGCRAVASSAVTTDLVGAAVEAIVPGFPKDTGADAGCGGPHYGERRVIAA